ncbi:MAG: hypothetical protein K6B17_02950 [Treponema sp.]|nr:hypothetical protein [Treponema sp.]
MFNIKSIAKFAGAGFVLSFIISIFSTQRFGVSLVRGLIFALVFGALAALICFLDSYFFDGTLGESDSSAKVSSGTSSVPKSGSIVNITIDDESLTEEDKAPLFDISSKRMGFARNEVNPSKVVNQAPPVSTPVQAVPDAPVAKNEEIVQAPEAAPAASSAPVHENVKTAEAPQFKPAPLQEVTSKKPAVDNDIDTLPDIGDEMAGGDDDIGLSNSGASVVTDSEFAETGTDGKPVSIVDASDATKHDTKTIAEAIRTLLKKDE